MADTGGADAREAIDHGAIERLGIGDGFAHSILKFAGAVRQPNARPAADAPVTAMNLRLFSMSDPVDEFERVCPPRRSAMALETKCADSVPSVVIALA